MTAGLRRPPRVAARRLPGESPAQRYAHPQTEGVLAMTGYEIVGGAAGVSYNGDGTCTASVGPPTGKVVIGGGGYLKLKSPTGSNEEPDFLACYPLIASYPSSDGSHWNVVFACPVPPSEPGWGTLTNYVQAYVYVVCVDA